VFHYTTKDGWNGIRSQVVWCFRASKPPGPHPRAAYFTILDPTTPYLAAKLLIPRAKLAYSFHFGDVGDLQPLPGGRGHFIVYSPADYPVEQGRQIAHGTTGL